MTFPSVYSQKTLCFKHRLSRYRLQISCPQKLPEAWDAVTTSALAILVALSKKTGKTLPWATVSEAIDGDIRARFLELAFDSGHWPCDYFGVQAVKL